MFRSVAQCSSPCVLWVERPALPLLCLSHSERPHTHRGTRVQQGLSPAAASSSEPLHTFTAVPQGRALIRGRKLCWWEEFQAEKSVIHGKMWRAHPPFTRQTTNTQALVLGRGLSCLCYTNQYSQQPVRQSGRGFTWLEDLRSLYKG